MILEKDKEMIRAISKKYRVKKVLLFGSSLAVSGESQDIDIAVEGVAPGDFFLYYGELMCVLSKPVDVIDLTCASKFTSLVEQEGSLLYGQL